MNRVLHRLRSILPNRLLGHRGHKILRTSGWSLIAKACAAANLFLSIPFVLSALGAEQFGAWATLISLVAFGGFLDFGFGNGTMNLVAAAHGRGASAEVAAIFHESRRTLTSIALWLALLALIALPFVPWQQLLGLPEAMSSATRTAVSAVLFSIIIAIPLNLANRVQLGLGRGDHAFRWQAIGQLATLTMVIILARAHASLAVLSAAAAATPLLASISNTVSVWRDPALHAAQPSASLDRASIRREIRNEGILFFGLQLTAALAYSTDLTLVSAFRGAKEAGDYAIVQRLFSAVPLSLSLLWAPLWPIYRQALASGDHLWVKRTLRRSLVSAIVLSVIGASALALGFGPLMGAWLHHPISVSGLLLGGFVAWCVVEAAGTALATFLNAASVLRYQLATACVFAAICLSGKVWVVARIDVALVPWVTVASYCLASALPFLWFGRRIIASAFAKKY